MVVYNNILAGASGATGADDYEISRSLRFTSGDSAYLSKDFSSAGNRQSWSWSGWVKRSKLSSTRQALFSGGTTTNDVDWLEFGYEADKFYYTSNSVTSSSTAVFRDISAWQHVLVTYNGSYLKWYSNGTEVHSVAKTGNLGINSAALHTIGKSSAAIGRYFDGYLADVHFIDGQALAPTDFGEFDDNNVWQPKEHTFSANPNNGTTWSSGTVTGTLYSGSSWANAFDGSLPSSLSTSNSAMSYSSTGDITLTFPTPISGTIRVYASGAAGSSTGTDSKIVLSDSSEITCNVLSSAPQFFSFGSKTNITSITLKQAQYGVRLGGIELNGYILIDGANDNSFKLNFNDATTNQALGYDASVSSPALNNKGGFDTVLYSGTGSDQTIKGLAFQPDLVWIKTRNEAENHFLVDSVRGVAKQIYVNSNASEYTNANRFRSFNSNGFTVGTTDDTNQSGNSFVAWAWKAGGTAGANTDGSITSQVSASSEYGFSVVSFTGNGTAGATVGHGLTNTPSLILLKTRGDTQNWMVYHSALGANKAVFLSTTDSAATSSVYFNDTEPTSSVFSLGTRAGINQNSDPMIAYCWSEVSGFSKFSSYTGNGSTSGPVVTTGFKPRYVLIKADIAGEDWVILDTARDTGDPVDQIFFANTTDAELTNSAYNVEIKADGFQIKNTNPRFNTNGETYIYAAFGDRAGNNFTPNNLIATAGLGTSNQGMDVVTYSGNGSTQSISSLAFQPDLVWLKGRSQSNVSNQLYDSVRGTSKMLQSDNNTAEGTVSGVTSFNSNGFTIGSNGGSNNNSSTYVAWCWRAGGAASSNTDGSITSSVSANTTYGFSVVKNTYSGSYGLRSVGHGLGKTPSLVISKRTDSTGSWLVHTRATGSYQMLTLNTTDTATAADSYFAADDSTFSLYHGHYTDNSFEYIHYCWSEIPGFSKISTYIGNGSSTGPVITTGFKPRFILIKGSSYASNWNLIDTARSGSNPRSDVLRPNGDGAESSTPTGTYGISLDVLDDGFQLKSGSSTNDINQTNETYIYMAFGDRPPGEIIDSLIDTPTNIEAESGNNPGNYATFNPLQQQYSSATRVLANGNLEHGDGTSNKGNYALDTSTIAAPPSGKYYWEMTLKGNGTNERRMIGIMAADANFAQYIPHVNSTDGLVAIWCLTGQKIINGSYTSYTSAYREGNTLGVALDQDNSTVTFYLNGTSLGAISLPTNMVGKSVVAAVSSIYDEEIVIANFGQRSFAYTPPTGYVSLCTTNLPDPTIADGSTAFMAKTYNGTGSTNAITGLNFSPDFLWLKRRNGANAHVLFDQIRGVTKALEISNTGAEKTNDPAIASFDANGFTVSGTSNQTNASGQSYIGWAWDAGSSTVSNTDGSITTSVRANPSVGFSIVKASVAASLTGGPTLGHGLNKKPEFIIGKNLDSTIYWYAYHKDLTDSHYLIPHLNSVEQNSSAVWGTHSSLDSSIFRIGTGTPASMWIPSGTNDCIFYVWTSVEGYSSFGSFNPNGTTDNSFVYTGFLPKFLILKYSSSAGDWMLLDTSRRPNGPSGGTLVANVANAEDGYYASNQANIDFLSNGFKIRVTGSPFGDSGRTVIYAAFAEHPFKYSRAY